MLSDWRTRRFARGGTAPAALSAANEVAVGAFVDGVASVSTEIADVVGAVLDAAGSEPLTFETLRRPTPEPARAARREVSLGRRRSVSESSRCPGRYDALE